MDWNRTVNPRVWEASDGIHFAMAEDSPYGGKGYTGIAEDNPYGDEGGYIGRVYARPLQRSLWGKAEPERVVGTAMWGLDFEAALRMCIKRFDDDAILPEREDGLSALQQAEESIRGR